MMRERERVGERVEGGWEDGRMEEGRGKVGRVVDGGGKGEK